MDEVLSALPPTCFLLGMKKTNEIKLLHMNNSIV